MVVTGKGLGGGLPIGAFIARRDHMLTLSDNPTLGHITTFGGNPVIAAAALATLQVVEEENLMNKVADYERRFRESVTPHPLVQKINGTGLMLAPILLNEKIAQFVVTESLKKGVIFFFLLFEKRAIRFSPPLTISLNELDECISILLEVLDNVPAELLS